MKDIFGQALLDFYHQQFEPPLRLHNEYGPPEIIPVERYFIDQSGFSDLEVFALSQVTGSILDIGAAAGRHALYLQDQKHDITALDISDACGRLMKEAGVKNFLIKNVFELGDKKYDTICMLMNGIGIAGTIKNLERLLVHLKKLTNPGGQLIVDSSDIAYLYEQVPKPAKNYHGELTFRYEYKNVLDEPFDWLYIDQEKLVEISSFAGWTCQIIFEDETDAFLARLRLM